MFGRWFGRNKQENGATSGRYRHGNDHLIDVRNVIKTFETAAGTFTALKGVSLQVDHGEFVAVIGKSGSGKSTLINMITGIDRPSSGQVFVGDTAVHTLNEGQMAAWRGRNLGIIFQFFQLLPTLTVIENVMLPMDFCNMYASRERRDRAMELLGLVEMTEHANKLPTAISGGQQQRVAIARALANDPPILVADEPTGNLDSKTAESVFELFEKMVAGGKTILMVTHDTDLAKRVTRAVVVADGQIVDESLTRALPSLSVEQLGRITAQFKARQYEPSAVIISQGDPSDEFFIVTKGQVEVHQRQHDGHERIVDRLNKGEFFGEIGLLHEVDRTATVVAGPAESVEVIALDRESFHNLMAESKLTRDELDRAIAARLHSTLSLEKAHDAQPVPIVAPMPH
jgi:ABC-type lipoprotein export system ATPase subunit